MCFVLGLHGPVGGRPHLGDAVVRASDDILRVRAEGRDRNLLRVLAFEVELFGDGVGVPQGRVPVFTGGENVPALGAVPGVGEGFLVVLHEELFGRVEGREDDRDA